MVGPEDRRFIVDHMLIKLGKYLRILGYDAQWDDTVRTHELILRGNNEFRTFITRNTRIDDQYPHPEKVVYVSSQTPTEQLQEVVDALGLDVDGFVFTRCIRCNVTLLRATEEEARRAVHLNVLKRHREFFRCPRCGTIFWRGSHVRNTCRKLGIRDICDMDDVLPESG